MPQGFYGTGVKAVHFGRNLDQMFNQVQYQNDSIVIEKDSRPVEARVDGALCFFRAHPAHAEPLGASSWLGRLRMLRLIYSSAIFGSALSRFGNLQHLVNDHRRVADRDPHQHGFNREPGPGADEQA